MKTVNPCRECTHEWHCMDADRELACNQFEDVAGKKARKEKDGKRKEGINEH
jgi:hypothetical protein